MTTYQPHPLAEIFPMLGGKPLQEMAESIKRSGLREPIVLLDNQVLDGRNREAACLLAGVPPKYRDFKPETDGPSPAHFVADKNLHHRHLTPAQAAAAAEEFVSFFESEATMTRGEAVSVAAAQFSVSPRSVQTAAALHKDSPEEFQAVKTGKKSLNQATRDAKAAQRDANRAAAETDTTPIRKKNQKEIEKQLGEGFATAFENGVILKDPADLEDFLKLGKEDRKLVAELVIRKWATKVALKFMLRQLDGESKLKDLVSQTIGQAKAPKVIVDGYVITCRKAVEGAD